MSDETGVDRLLSVAEAAGEIGERASLERNKRRFRRRPSNNEKDKQAFDDATEKRNKRLEAQFFDDSPPMALWSGGTWSLVDTANASLEQSARFQENANWVEDPSLARTTSDASTGRICAPAGRRRGPDRVDGQERRRGQALATAATVFQLCADWISGPKTDTCPPSRRAAPSTSIAGGRPGTRMTRGLRRLTRRGWPLKRRRVL